MTNPLDIFKENWVEARSLKDANAEFCSLATVSASGQASIRTLVLREVSKGSFVIFINKSSPKWQDLMNSGKIELLVFWPSIMQQYRIRGNVSEISQDIMESHWRKKPYESKIIDHFYAQKQAQSTIVDSRKTLLSSIDELKEKYPSKESIPFSDNAAGISLQASFIEHWQDSPADRIHKRHQYHLVNGNWEKKTMVP
ncbi:MAG: pyridoxamine 5'-phosphate oxidase [Oceanicoccus sp.]|jgi:pyridoxamine 5'-phosphate oxidase